MCEQEVQHISVKGTWLDTKVRAEEWFLSMSFYGMWLVLFVRVQTQTFLENSWDASCKGRRNSEADKDAVKHPCDKCLSIEILVGAASSTAQGACYRHYHRLSTAP